MIYVHENKSNKKVLGARAQNNVFDEKVSKADNIPRLNIRIHLSFKWLILRYKNVMFVTMVAFLWKIVFRQPSESSEFI